MFDDIGANADTILTFLTTIATLITAAGWLFERLKGRKTKRLSYRVHWNAAITRPEGKSFPQLALFHGKRKVEHAEVAVLRVENTGGKLEPDDFDPPVMFDFGGRQIIWAVVADTVPESLEGEFAGLNASLGLADEAAAGIGPTKLRLPPVTMGHGDRYKLSVLLEGEHCGVIGTWDRHGDHRKLIPEERRVRRSRVGLALGGATLALFGLLLGLIVVPTSSAPPPVAAIACRTGTVSVSGSTALEPAIIRLAAEYKKRCQRAQPDAKPQILVKSTASGVGLDRLVRQGAQSDGTEVQREWLVMYDGIAADTADVLARHTLGVGVFGIVAHRGAVPDGALTSSEVQRLWNGQASTFDKVGGSVDPVTLISRQEGSGTRTAFEEKVLGGRPARAPITSSECTGYDLGVVADVVHCVRETTEDVLTAVSSLEGAIGYADVTTAGRYPDVEVLRLDGRGPTEQDVASEGYPFWAVENLYTYGEPPVGTVLKDFLAFLETDEARTILISKFGYLPCSRFSKSALAKACAS